MITLFFFILPALISSFIASIRNRSALKGFVVGLLAGWLGLLLLWLGLKRRGTRPDGTLYLY